MIFSLFIYFFLIKTILLIENNKTLKDGFYEIFNEYVKQFNLSELNLSKECLFKEKYYPDLNKTYLYYKKLALDSSKSLNDISTYDECMNNRHKIQNNTSNFSYVLIYIDKRFTKKLNLSYEHTYLLAMCMVNNINCKKDDYKKLFLFFYNKYLENLTQEDRISIFFLDKTTDIFKYNFISFEQIPFYIISVYIIFYFFKKFIFKFFKIFFCCCLTKDKEKKNDIKEKKNKEKKVKCLKIIQNIFSFSKNFEIFLSKETEDNIYNDDGINYIKGIKGISMLLYLFGVLYFNLYNSPLTQKTKESFTKSLKSPLSFLFFFGLKYSPRILLSCSGFNLFYKFICYLDEQCDENNKTEKKDKVENKDSDDIISCKMLFSFILHQLYKYVYFILITSFFIFSFFTLYVFIFKENPMWEIFYCLFLKDEKKKNLKYDFILFILGLKPIFLLYEDSMEYILNYFWLIQCEIIFFLLTTFILFFIHKYQFNLNRIFIIILLIIELLIKILLVFFSEFLYTKELYPSFIYSNINYGFTFKSSLLNYPYFLIGVIFSALNYSIQKSLNYDKCHRQQKLYLASSIKLMKLIKKLNKNYHYLFRIICIIIILLFGFSQSIFFFIIIDIRDIKSTITSFFNDLFFKIIMLFDTECVVISIHLLSLFFSISEEKYIISFLTHKLWIFLDKIYFSYILLINPFILYMIYREESKITFTIENSLFYSLSYIFLLLLLVIFCYVLFELPFRRITKYLFKIQKNKKNYNMLNILEQEYNDKNTQIIFDESKFQNEENENEEDNEDEKKNNENDDSFLKSIK